MLRADLPQSASFDIQPMHLKQRFSLKLFVMLISKCTSLRQHRIKHYTPFIVTEIQTFYVLWTNVCK